MDRIMCILSFLGVREGGLHSEGVFISEFGTVPEVFRGNFY